MQMLTPVDLPKPPEASVSALAAALAALAEDGAPVSRDAALGAFRRHLARIQQHVQHAFEQDQITGLQAARLLGKLTDGLISALYEHATSDTGFGEPEHLSIAGTGGYGRGVLAPFSDIDLLFLTAAEPSRQTLQVVEYMLYFLWDLGREGRPRHALDRGLPGRRRQGHHDPHRAARFAAHRRRRGAVRRFPHPLPRGLQGRRRRRVHRRQAGRTRGAPPPLRRQPVRRRAEREGRPRRPARPADALLDRALRVRHADHGRARRCRRRADAVRGEAWPPRLGIPVDRAVSSALRRRPRRGAADVRSPAGGRRAHGLHPARPPGRRRTFHAPLFPDRARGRPPDPHPGAGHSARGAGSAGDRAGDRPARC